MGRDDAGREHDDDRDGVLIGGPEERVIDIVDHRAEWAERFNQEKARIEAAVGPVARRIEHIGSTAVPELAAKPVVDVMLSVDDPEDESSYLPAMERAGYVLRVREPGHRMFRTPGRDVHVHVWKAGSDDEQRHLVFRNRLRSHADDRAEYEQKKRDLATQFHDMNAYADAKSAVIEKIVRQVCHCPPRCGGSSASRPDGPGSRRSPSSSRSAASDGASTTGAPTRTRMSRWCFRCETDWAPTPC